MRRLVVGWRALRGGAPRARAVTPDAVMRTLPSDVVPSPWARSAFSAGAARSDALPAPDEVARAD
jgi:hypothetical protein